MKPKFDLDLTQSPTVEGFSKADLKKKRNFPGAWTKKGFGPVNAPKVASGNDSGVIATGGYGTSADPVVLGESIAKEKFTAFLESLKNDENKESIEIVKTGYNTCLEAKKK